MSESDSFEAWQPAGLLRRVGAIVSDSLVVFGLLALSTLFLFVPLLSLLGRKAMLPSEVGWVWSGIYFGTMLGVWFGFFGYFWTRSGQTVGMRAWRIRVENDHSRLMTWPMALKRWVAAGLPWLPCLAFMAAAQELNSAILKYAGEGLLLLGVTAWLVMYVDPLRRTWHDRFSGTRVIRLPKL